MNVSCPDCRSIFRVDPAKVPANGVRARCSVCSGVITIPSPSGVSTPSTAAPRTATPAMSAASPPPTYTPPLPPAPARPAEMPTARRREESAGPVTATATPPSPVGGTPEFRSTPATPGFTAPRPPSGSGPSAPPFVPPSRPVSPTAPPMPPAPRAPRPAAAAPPRAAAPPPFTPPGSSAAIGDAAARRPLNPFLSRDPNQRAKRLARALVSDIITYHPAKHAEGLRDGTLKQLFREEIKKSFEEYIAQVGQQLAEGTTYFQEALNEVLAGGRKIF